MSGSPPVSAGPWNAGHLFIAKPFLAATLLLGIREALHEQIEPSAAI